MSDRWQPLDEFGFDSALARQAGVSLVMFGQPHCGACRGWHAQLPHWLAADFTLFYVDVAVATALARRFELFHLPAFALYRDGVFHCLWRSAFSRGEVGRTLAIALAAPAQEEP
ncbi:thioredoxin family protein [Vogesella oryzae]|uniref:thioredoxin family protein n=1 Tax=Vogesella oryzae TaxID=1735285 RepID=UPI0015833E2C|nr:thioredoxin family protein [Vogesella oryzae]